MDTKNTTIHHLAEMAGGQVSGNANIVISGFAPLESAEQGQISFLVKAGEKEQLKLARASAIIVPKEVEECEGKTLIHVKDPYLAVAIIHGYLEAQPFIAKGIHPKAFVEDDCQFGKEISVEPMAVVGERVRIGERVSIGAGTVIGNDVEIGHDTTIMANVTIYEKCKIGNRVRLHSGTVIGSDGYGYAANEIGEHIKRPQVGIVQVDDDVEIGANSCVDRAAYGVTRIKSGTKIDNLVQVAHNVVVGENCLLVSQVGLAGSTTLGRNVVMGGQSATGGHLVIGDQVMIAARGAVNKDQPKGAVLGGAPGLPIRQWAKATAIFGKLPELHKNVKRNTKAIEELTCFAGKKE